MIRFHQFITAALLTLIAVVGTGCSVMESDRTDCPTGLYVRFVYDYNIQRADMFKDHVGYVTVYVFDENGRKVAERSIGNDDSAAPLATYGYAMHFSTDELPAGHRYRLMAVAMQRDWNKALTLAGAKYHRTEVNNANDLIISLDHMNGSHPLDTLWHTLKVMPDTPTYGYDTPAIAKTRKPYSVYPTEEQMVTIEEGYATYATVSLIRDTKHLNIVIRQIDSPEDVYAEDFTVSIEDDNSTLAADNSLIPGDSILYTPYAQWTTRFGDDGLEVEDGKRPTRAGGTPEVTARAAHYDLMFNRLMFDDDSEKSAKLHIRNAETGETIAYINLPYMLAEGRTAWELYNYSPQEYLDREYQYDMNLFLKGGKWLYCDIVVNVLSWARRKQNIEL